jgi:hypothetical protein
LASRHGQIGTKGARPNVKYGDEWGGNDYRRIVAMVHTKILNGDPTNYLSYGCFMSLGGITGLTKSAGLIVQ